MPKPRELRKSRRAVRVVALGGASEGGGATRAALRLHAALLQQGVDATFLARFGPQGAAKVLPAQHASLHRRLMNVASRGLDGLPRVLYRDYDGTKWTANWLAGGTLKRLNALPHDIVHLHWVGAGLVSIGDVRRYGRPIVWTLHDMWPFTGGCHYSHGCVRFEHGCGSCPVLGSTMTSDLSRLTHGLKMRAWRDSDITFVAPSRWLARLARNSAVGHGRRVEVIANGIDVDVFTPHDKTKARRELGLPLDRRLILTAGETLGTDPWKGYAHLQRALNLIARDERFQDVDLVALGADPTRVVTQSGVPTHALGYISDEGTMARVYASADVFVTPSLADNLPNTIMEALACGTPCVAFDIGGIPDMIEDGFNGVLASPVDAHRLRDGIAWVLENRDRLGRMSENARRTALDRFDVNHSARAYAQLYQDLLRMEPSCSDRTGA